MRFAAAFLLPVIIAALHLRAATPPVEQLLPADTLWFVSIPEWDKAKAYLDRSAQGQLWRDPAMRPFRDHFLEQLKEGAATSFERALGMKFEEFANLVHGQITFAFTQGEWGKQANARPGLLLLVDTKDQQEALSARLNDMQKRWVDAGKQLKTTRIRELEFTTLLLGTNDLATVFGKVAGGENEDEEEEDAPASNSKESLQPIEISIGQSGPLLIAGNSPKEIEKILIRQTGGLTPALAEQAVYEADHARFFRGALAFAWVNFGPVYQHLVNQSRETARARPVSPFAVSPEKVLGATGLAGLKTIAARLSGDGEGTLAEVFLRVPESERQGLFRLLVMAPKDSSPPGFVPASVVKFSRWRLDGQKTWATLERMFTSISPQISGMLQLGFEAAGKDKDPNFNLKAAVIGNLGDDFVTVEKRPKSLDLADLNARPTLFLVGSPNPDRLVQGLNVGTALLPLMAGEPTVAEREFLGRTIYSLSLPAASIPGGSKGAERSFNFAASGGYAALSGDIATLEEYLRSGEPTSSPLRDLTGLNDAAQKVGGMSTGTFGYQNQGEAIRLWIESAKTESAALDKLLSLAPLAAGKRPSTDAGSSRVGELLDVTLLPPFEKISKYFSFIVSSLSSSNDGFSWRLFAPVPPGLKE